MYVVFVGTSVVHRVPTFSIGTFAVCGVQYHSIAVLSSSDPHGGNVSAIVPAYCEAERIHRVLDVLTTHPLLRETIVVADDPSGRTADVVRRYGNVRYLAQRPSHGKGHAVSLGVEQATGEIILLCDADVIGLTREDVTAILLPVLEERVDLSVAVRGRRIPLLLTFFARWLPLVTLIGGERAFVKRLWQQLPDPYKRGYRVEQGLNVYAARHGRGLAWKSFPHLRQQVKEQKYGFVVGLQRRWRLLRDVLFVFSALPRTGGKISHEG